MEKGWGWCGDLWLSYGLPPFSAFALLPCFQHSHHTLADKLVRKKLKVTRFCFFLFHPSLSSLLWYLSLSACMAKPRWRYSYLTLSLLGRKNRKDNRTYTQTNFGHYTPCNGHRFRYFFLKLQHTYTSHSLYLRAITLAQVKYLFSSVHISTSII